MVSALWDSRQGVDLLLDAKAGFLAVLPLLRPAQMKENVFVLPRNWNAHRMATSQRGFEDGQGILKLFGAIERERRVMLAAGLIDQPREMRFSRMLEVLDEVQP